MLSVFFYDKRNWREKGEKREEEDWGVYRGNKEEKGVEINVV